MNNHYFPKTRYPSVLSLLVFITAIFLQSLGLAQAANQAEEDQAFTVWMAKLRQEAVKKGFSQASIALAFSEITPPVKRIIKNDRNQAEVVETYASYLNTRVSEWKQTKGREKLVEHADIFNKITADYGVQGRFIAAIWGMETNFGTYPLAEPLFNVLATLAYDPRRAKLFRAQFFAALKMLDSGFPSYTQLKSSWAGAMGQSQFIPETYLQLAVDYDGDGKRDIWNTEADVFASIANYFKYRNWTADQTWGSVVQLPPHGETTLPALKRSGIEPAQHCKRFDKSLGAWRDLQEWQKLGVRREDGTNLPSTSIPAALILGDEDDDKGYLVYQNFCTIMAFNPAFKYALSIGLLADTLAVE